MITNFILLLISALLFATVFSLKFEPILLKPWIKRSVKFDSGKYIIFQFDNIRSTEDKGDILINFEMSIEPIKIYLYTSILEIIYNEAENSFSNEIVSFTSTEIIIQEKDPININGQSYFITINESLSNYITMFNELDHIPLAANDYHFIKRFYSTNQLIIDFTNEDKNLFIVHTYYYNEAFRGTLTITERETGTVIYEADQFGMNTVKYINEEKDLKKNYYIILKNSQSSPISQEIELRLTIDMMPEKIIELTPENAIPRHYISKNEYNFYVDVSQYDSNEENTIQFQLTDSLDYDQGKLVMYAKMVQCSKESLKDQYDFDQNYFPIKLITNNNYQRTYVIITFYKNRPEKKNIYLLIRVIIKDFAGKSQLIKTVLSKRIEVIDLTNYKDNQEISENRIERSIIILPNIPIHLKVRFNPDEINKEQSVVFRSVEPNNQHITFGNLILEGKDNPNGINNILYVLQSGTTIHPSKSTLTFSYNNYDLKSRTITFEIAFVNEKLINLGQTRHIDKRPIEMINCLKDVYLIGSYGAVSSDEQNDFKQALYIETLYGSVSLRYMDRLEFKNKFIETLPDQVNSQSIQTETVMTLDSQIDFFKLTCNSPSSLIFHFFNENQPADHTEIVSGSSQMFLLKPDTIAQFKIKFLNSEHYLQIISLNKLIIECNLDKDHYETTKEMNKININFTTYIEIAHTLSLQSISENSYVYIKFMTKKTYGILIHGNSEIKSLSNLIKLSSTEDYEYAHLNFKLKTDLQKLRMKYQFSISRENFYLYPIHSITIENNEKELNMTISNPYRKEPKMLNKTNNEIYYFFFEFPSEEDLPVFLDLTYVKEKISSNISITSPSIISANKIYYIPYEKSHALNSAYIIMSINQCNNPLHMTLKYDNEMLNTINVADKRTIWPIKNFNIDMKLSINSMNNDKVNETKMAMNYFYATRKDYENYQINSNFTILVRDDGSNLHLQWHPYIINHPEKVTYSIYLSSPDKDSEDLYNNFCSINTMKAYEELTPDKNNKYQLFTEVSDFNADVKLHHYSIKMWTEGKYVVNIIGRGHDNFPIVTNYDAVEIDISRPFKIFMWSIIAVVGTGLLIVLTIVLVRYLKAQRHRREIKISDNLGPLPDDDINTNVKEPLIREDNMLNGNGAINSNSLKNNNDVIKSSSEQDNIMSLGEGVDM